ncbi:MAG: hypothetical protein WA637_11260 [Terriglobales bacterium]
MVAAGVKIQIREEWRESARALDKTLDIAVGGGLATFVFDMMAGCAGYVISVRLVGQALGTVLDCRLTTSWDDEIVLASFNDEGDSMCRLGLLQYPRDQVLNLRIQNSLRFQRGQMIEGVILATGVNPIPEAYRHGLIVPITLALLDQNENQVRETADLFVDRLSKPKNKFVPRKTGLFDRGRIVPTREPVTSQEDSSVPQVPEIMRGKKDPAFG